jgi:hypothetical protein
MKRNKISVTADSSLTPNIGIRAATHKGAQTPVYVDRTGGQSCIRWGKAVQDQANGLAFPPSL